MEDLLQKLKEKDPKKRIEALYAAANQEDVAFDQKLQAAVCAALWDADDEVRRVAVETVGRFSEFLHVAFDGSAVARIHHLTSDDNPRVRADAAVTLALLPEDPEHLVYLRRLLNDPAPIVRQDAAAAIGDLKDRASLEILEQLLADEDVQVRFEAAFALAAMKDSRGREILENALLTSRRRLDACEGLKRLGDAGAIAALQKVSQKFFMAWPDRLTVFATLYALGDTSIWERIQERTKARNREERAYALALIGTHQIREGADLLASVAQDPKETARDTAVRGLGELQEASQLPVLEAILSEESAPMPLRLDAVKAVASFPGKRAEQILSRIKGHKSDQIAQAAEKALLQRQKS